MVGGTASAVYARQPAHYIAGEWVALDPGDTCLDVINPANGSVLGRTPRGGAGTVDAACQAAWDAFGAWSQTSPSRRGAALMRLADALEARRDELAEVITAEVGVPVRSSGPVQVDLGISILRYYGDLAGGYAFEEDLGNSKIVRRPRGVVAAITPWNYPLYQIASKIGPALAAGCTVVLKPSDVAPFNAVVLAEQISAANIPPGVINIIFGTGEGAGETLVSDERIGLVSFTGSTRAGRRVAALAGERVCPVALELGGKSGALILQGADLRAAIEDTIGKCFANSGQNCGATSRMIVPEDMYQEASAIAVEVAGSYTVGDPTESSTQLGPVVNEAQYGRVRSFIEVGVREGAQLLLGDDPDSRTSGFFIGPHVFGGVDPSMTIAQEEIFGPVLSIIPFNGDVDEGLAIVNGTKYGLCGSVWAADDRTAESVASRVIAGQVDVNGAPYNPLSPFGGFGLSGYGRELGPFGIEDYVALQAIQLPANS